MTAESSWHEPWPYTSLEWHRQTHTDSLDPPRTRAVQSSSYTHTHPHMRAHGLWMPVQELLMCCRVHLSGCKLFSFIFGGIRAREWKSSGNLSAITWVTLISKTPDIQEVFVYWWVSGLFLYCFQIVSGRWDPPLPHPPMPGVEKQQGKKWGITLWPGRSRQIWNDFAVSRGTCCGSACRGQRSELVRSLLLRKTGQCVLSWYHHKFEPLLWPSGLITPSSTERMVQQRTPNYLITSILVTAGAAIVIKCDFRFYGCAWIKNELIKKHLGWLPGY